MKNLLSVLILFFLFADCCTAVTTTSYDECNSKTGSFRTNGNTITQYDKYGSKTGSYKQTSSGYNAYDKYGEKQEVTEKLHQDTIHTTNMETKQAVLKQTQTAQLLNMINTETKQVHLKLIQAEKQFTTISTGEKPTLCTVRHCISYAGNNQKLKFILQEIYQIKFSIGIKNCLCYYDYTWTCSSAGRAVDS